MRTITSLVFAVIMLLGFFTTNTSQDKGMNEEKNDKSSIVQNEEIKICQQFYTPFMLDKERTEYKSISNRMMDGYGVYRRQHKHAGIDLKGGHSEKVYSIGVGKVKAMLYPFPHNAVLIEHYLPDGTTIISSYVHVAEVTVSVGDWVDEKTSIARLFNEDERKKAGFKNNHLHLEIRKFLEDGGKASYSCKTIEELNKYFIDPEKFFTEKLK